MHTTFIEFGFIFIAATACAFLVKAFKQPLILGYVICGITLGPIGARLLENQQALDGFRHLGIALLLFLIGMELDWKKARHLLGTTFFLGTLQVVGSFAAGLLCSFLFNLDPWTGIYIGSALAFSSAVVVVKILSESGDMNSLHGRLSIGLLLFQDLSAAVVLILLGGLSIQSSLSFPVLFLLLLLKSACILVILFLAAQYFLPIIFSRIARSGELLFLSSISWCFIVAISASYFGLPLEVGAFLAGISLASLPYTLDITTRLRSLRDFFIIMLFVGMGSDLHLPTRHTLLLTLSLTGITLFLKPFLAFVILHARGFKSRTSFFTALSQGQISEFSLIAIELGVLNHLVSHEVASSVVFAAVSSLVISTILLGNRVRLYNILRPFLSNLKQKRKNHYHASPDKQFKDHIIIFGYHRMGYHILVEIKKLGHTVLVVDSNPDIVKRLQEQGIDAIYGDIQDEDLLEVVQATQASMVISTIPHREETEFLIHELKEQRSKAIIIVTSHHIDDALGYYEQGASYVILPHIIGGEQVAALLMSYEGKSLDHFVEEQQKEALKLLKTKNHSLYYN